MKYTLFDGPATVQLATPDSCLVVHLVRGSGRHSQACAPILKAIICDEQFIKAGCALDDDVLELYDLWNGLDAKSRLDLGGIGGIKNNKRRGLKTLSKHILGVHLPKPKAQTLSDWSQVPLTEHQVSYSARDAWAGAAIANKLAEYDPETFGHGNLVELLLKQETPVSQLADRMERHKRAKQDLGALLKPYPKSRYHGRNIPNRVQSRAQQLRDVIKNSKSFERPLVFEVDHLGIDLDSNM
jgi:ribonuclease D